MTSEEAPWYTAYPNPKNSDPRTISRAEVLEKLHNNEVGRDFLLVDLRRNDHQGGTIRGSLNLPAQSLFHSLPTLYNICQVGKINTVIWYCGSSRGRGPRAAGWLDDLIQEQGGPIIKSLVLLEGITGWVTAGEKYTNMMDNFEKDAWNKS